MVFQGTPRIEHYNPLGMVHGGYAATLLDSCVGCAVHTMLPAGKGYTTLELKVNYIRAMTDRTGPVRAEGRTISRNAWRSQEDSSSTMCSRTCPRSNER